MTADLGEEWHKRRHHPDSSGDLVAGGYVLTMVQSRLWRSTAAGIGLAQPGHALLGRCMRSHAR